MAFADPQSINNGTAVSLPRTGSGISNGVFTSADGTVKLTISSTYGKRTRRIARLDYNKIAADPFVTTQNDSVSMSVYIVIDTPKQGYASTEQIANAAALASFLTASTNAGLTQLVGGES